MATDSERSEDMEEITLSQAAAEFHINRGTLNNWIHDKRIPARKEFGELGIQYYLIRRGDLSQFLRNRPKRGRPLKRTS